MKPEFFPDGEDIILQNETPTDMYILVNGAAVSSLYLWFSIFLSIVPSSNPTFFLDARILFHT